MQTYMPSEASVTKSFFFVTDRIALFLCSSLGFLNFIQVFTPEYITTSTMIGNGPMIVAAAINTSRSVYRCCSTCRGVQLDKLHVRKC